MVTGYELIPTMSKNYLRMVIYEKYYDLKTRKILEKHQTLKLKLATLLNEIKPQQIIRK